MPSYRPRPATEITRAVWRALFLREAVARLFASRTSWFWIIAEPVAHIAFLMFMYTVVRVRTVGGIETGLWIMIGLLAFFTFRRPLSQMVGAINANRSLFAYRQVKPIDTVLVRAALEGFLMTLTIGLMTAASMIWGHFVAPEEPLALLAAFFGLWLLSLGLGLVLSALTPLIEDIGNLVRISMLPLSLLSGVVLPIANVSGTLREWIMLNPVAHGIEGARAAFAPHYHAAPETRMSYLYLCALCLVFVGLALQRKLATKLAAQ